MLYPQTNAIRLATSLDGLWEWSYKKSFPQQGAPNLFLVPGRFSSHPKLKNYFGELWLRTTFQVNALQLTQRLVLFFESVSHGVSVYVNGKLAVSHHGTNQPFEVAINDLVHPGENQLYVYLSNLLDENSCPAATLLKTESGYRLENVHDDVALDGGIDGHVWLYSTAWSFIDDIGCHAHWIGNECKLSLYASLLGFEQTVHWYLHADNKIIADATGTNSVMTLQAPSFWRPNSPHRFQLEIQTSAENTPIDHYVLPIGLLKNQWMQPKKFLTWSKDKEKSLTTNVLQNHESLVQEGAALLLTQEPLQHDLLTYCDITGIKTAPSLPAYPPKNSKLQDTDARLSAFSALLHFYKHHPSITAWGIGLFDSDQLPDLERLKPYLKLLQAKDSNNRPLFFYTDSRIIFYVHDGTPLDGTALDEIN